jgi:hypothetical protein
LKKSTSELTLMGIKKTPLTFGDHARDQNSKVITLRIYGCI